MKELSAKVYRPAEFEHSGTAWLVSETYVLTAFHCVCDREHEDQPYAAPYKLEFDSGKIVEAEVAEFHCGIDAALLHILDDAIPISGKLLFGGPPAPLSSPPGEQAGRPIVALDWTGYGYPSAFPAGLAVAGQIRLTDAKLDSGELAMQLICAEGGMDGLDGLSGAAVVDHDQYQIGLIRSAPKKLRHKVIHATSLKRVQEELPMMQDIVEKHWHRSIDRVSPKLLKGTGLHHGTEENRSVKSICERNKLVRKNNSLYGRDRTVKTIVGLIEGGARLLTLAGPAGAGKTRLALAVGQRLLKGWDVYYAELDRYGGPPRVLEDVASVFGLKQAHEDLVEETLTIEIGDRKVLLILDDQAQLAGSRDLIARLLHNCVNLCIITVGNKSLGWDGESTFAVQALPLMVGIDELEAADLLVEGFSPMLHLFSDCARAVDPQFKFDNENIRSVVKLCNRSEGLPLAIEIIAAHTSTMLTPPDEDLAAFMGELKKAEGLSPEDKLGKIIMLVAGSLDNDTRSLLWRLSVLVGEFTIDSAEAVGIGVGGAKRAVIIEKMNTLVRKALLSAGAGRNGNTYYRMPPSVQQLARRRLEESGKLGMAMRSHAGFYARLAAKADRRMTLLSSAELQEWFERLELEYGNIRAALHWLSQNAPDRDGRDSGLAIAGNLFWFWNLRGSLGEGLEWAEKILEKKPARLTENRAMALYCSGGLAFLRGDFRHARSRLTASVADWEAIKNDRRLAFALVILGMVAIQQNHLDEALAHERRAVELFRRAGDKCGLALSLNDLANVTMATSDLDGAEALYRQSLAIWREMENDWGIGLTTSNLGHLACGRGHYDEASRWLVEAMQLQGNGRYQWGFAQSLKFVGHVLLGQKNFQLAAEIFYDSLVFHQRLGRKQLVADCLDGMAEAGAALHQPLAAAHLFGAAMRLRDDGGEDLPPMPRAARDKHIEMARGESANPEQFATALDEGKAMNFKDVMKKAADYAHRFAGAKVPGDTSTAAGGAASTAPQATPSVGAPP